MQVTEKMVDAANKIINPHAHTWSKEARERVRAKVRHALEEAVAAAELNGDTP